MASSKAPRDDGGRSLLQDWRKSLSPLKVDIVGDFAGKELFAIHGEALISHCIPAARVDYQHGFQLLHAIHAIESFLSKLRDRGCNFHIIWFDSWKDLCIPFGTPDENGYKYLLTRAVLIRHFAHQSTSGISHRFDTINCEAFHQYLASNPQYFFMCSDGRATHSRDHPLTLAHLSIGFRMSFYGYCVAFIDGIEFRNSKVYVSITAPMGRMAPLRDHQPTVHHGDPHEAPKQNSQFCQTIHDQGNMTPRDIVTLHALSHVLDGEVTHEKMKGAVCILIQLVLLRHYHISQRSFPQSRLIPREYDYEVMKEFGEAALNVIDAGVSEVVTTSKWDVFDLFDGRLYLEICSAVPELQLPSAFVTELSELAKSLAVLCGTDVSDILPAPLLDMTGQGIEQLCIHTGQNQSTVLPFSHPIINQYLQKVQLEAEDKSQPAYSRIFQELTHWHNAKKPINPKYVPKPPGFFARRRNQRFMADTIAYSASLTGASGKNIEPEVIIARKPTEQDAKSVDGSRNDWKLALKEQDSAKSKKRAQKGSLNAGKGKAREAAEAKLMVKSERESLAANESWKNRLREFENEGSLVKRLLKVEKYLLGLSTAPTYNVNAEISLYICHILTLLRKSGKYPKQNVPHIEAILWSKVLTMNKSSLTREIASQLGPLSSSLGIPLELGPLSALPRKELPFTMINTGLRHMQGSEAVDFQLEFCGPYLERSFDPAPDHRVSFHPDAWQRKVLDAIDADKSLFVVAPTSAGKTFISFYAMKKVLQASDDGVIVYVAPTKALVNQIAAEIQARFSKSYHHEGRSVWAIHTRDYRVNNPQGCQILVTVPHILQIMLLAPSNAKTPSSWARRVKRIIFDEVHCIGQSDDGIIWEQLLLLAPCPIIALSATVGNPFEFKEWLGGVQEVKGFDLEMIVHSSRYSDLRKYIYDSPRRSNFKGLDPVERLPVPGLESDIEVAHRFAFVHPVAALIGRNPDSLNDASLEPRDCLTLWKCMAKYENDRFKLDKSLDPKNALPPVVKKSDIVQWEYSLKKQLKAWMADPDSPFGAIQEDLRGESYKKLASDRSQGMSDTIVESPQSSVPCPSVFKLALDLRACGSLPAIFFDYDRVDCERILLTFLKTLQSAEAEYRSCNLAWKDKMARFEKWKKDRIKAQAKSEKLLRGRQKDEDGLNKLDMAREMGSQEESPWDTFDPDAPLPEFSFADTTKLSNSELEELINTLKYQNIKPGIIKALRRGLGVHHAGMNRQYRQVVEMLFRKGFLTVVIATGTLALGINMPCKTVVFTGDSVYLTALNYRQASGRSGRRGFDVLGNVVFHGIPPKRALEIMSARLPDLRGQFPTSVTLILRLFGLLHGTNNSDYAEKAVKSLLTQTRLYLGGPSAQMSVQHHLRFSIDYLRRQHLLSEDGAPLNFSGLVGHLYFTENAAFAFHSLLKEGYFHDLCSDTHGRGMNDVILKIMLVLCHLFCRVPCNRYKDSSWFQNSVHRSPSLVILPELPEAAAQTLREHNQETLRIFQNYVSTYTSQHLRDTPDVQLPFTKHNVEPNEPCDMNILPSLNRTVVRSPFAALSGFTDEFETIGELCDTVRAGVFLEESAIPYIPIAPHETNGVPWNAYIYDFFKHGDMDALVRDNGIKKGDVWFHLKDFSLILATIVTSLANFLNPDADDDDAAMIDVQDVADIIDENEGIDLNEEKREIETPVGDTAKLHTNKAATRSKGKGKKAVVAESWDAETSDGELDDIDSFQSNTSPGGDSKYSGFASRTESTTPSWSQNDDQSLSKVYMAFKMLHEQFDEKFKKVWA